jgi:hypothetical protein
MNFLIAPIDPEILCNCNETTSTVVVNGNSFQTLQFTVDGTESNAPIEGATSFRDTSLADKVVAAVFLQSLADFVNYTEWENSVDGGFDWINGRQFHSGEHYTIFY